MADRSIDPALRQALEALERTGLLFLHDARRPSLTALVAGEPVRGSWWGHAAGQRIFQVANALADGSDVAFVPLLEGKVTLVHRRLWPALVSVGEERAPWQLEGLDRAARTLLGEVDRAGRLRVSGPPGKTLGKALLVHSEQVHTEGGAHVTELQTWKVFRTAHGIEGSLDTEAARAVLKEAGRALEAPRALPWCRSGRRERMGGR
jgi:hypothetical protein